MVLKYSDIIDVSLTTVGLLMTDRFYHIEGIEVDKFNTLKVLK